MLNALRLVATIWENAILSPSQTRKMVAILKRQTFHRVVTDMQKILRDIQTQFIHNHYEELVAARRRADAVDTADMTLGEGERVKVLAATRAETVDELIQGAKVVKRLKRAALIQVHNLLYYCNRYGVMSCTVPATVTFGRFKAQWGPCIHFAGGHQILDRLGVQATYSGKGDKIFDYSGCTETRPQWLEAA